MAWVIDLDGVMWLAHQPIPGSAEAVGRLLAAGEEVAFVTNNASAPPTSVEAALAAMGVDASGRVLTSAQAAAGLIEPDERVLVCAGSGALDAALERGAQLLADHEEPTTAQVVLVGLAPDLSYDLLARACLAVRAGARLVAANADSTYPTPRGLLPGAGAILAAIVTATGADPVVAGKPHEPMAALVRARLGPSGIVAGDRLDTDGAFARTLGYRFGLVLSGVTTEPPNVARDSTERPSVPVDVVAPDLAGLVESVLG